jgi:hypothetical protein
MPCGCFVGNCDGEPYSSQQRAAELLITQGRHWLSLTERDIHRGARAVMADPRYRTKIWDCARRHSEECCTCPSVAEINAAFELLGGRR